MTQIKLSIAFVLAAAAIAPVLAQPTGINESNELATDVVHHPHHHHHKSHHHQHKATPEKSSLEPSSNHRRHHQRHHRKRPEQLSLEQKSDTTPTPSAREFVDEFEARGLLTADSEGGILNTGTIENAAGKVNPHKDAQLPHTHKTRKSHNNDPERTVKHLENKERHLKRKDHRLHREGRKLKHSLKSKKHRLLDEDNKLGRERRTLERQDKEIAAREYAESEDMFERAETEDGASTSAGPVPMVRPSTSHGRRLGRGLLGHRPFKGPGRIGQSFGHGFQGRRPFNGPQRPRLGPMIRRGSARRGIGPREYAEFDDMFERDLKDLELDARDFDESDDMFERDLEEFDLDAREFDDELYLD